LAPGRCSPTARSRPTGSGARAALLQAGICHHALATGFFLRGLTIGALLAGSVAALGAVLAVLFLPAQPATATAHRGG
jgi:hypothetical protein